MASLRGLSTLLTILRKACAVIGKFSLPLRQFVPAEVQADYDIAIAQILAACIVITAIDWLGDETGTNQG